MDEGVVVVLIGGREGDFEFLFYILINGVVQKVFKYGFCVRVDIKRFLWINFGKW